MFTLLKFYLICNATLAIAYGLTRLMGELPLFTTLTAAQKLKLARFCLITACMTFFILPCYGLLLKLLPQTVDITTFNAPGKVFTYIVPELPTMNGSIFICLFLLLGSIVQAVFYIKHLASLRKLIQSSYVIRVLKRIHILSSEQTTVPCCWSFLFKHYIFIPPQCFEPENQLPLVISHELQHIRQWDTYWLNFLSCLRIIAFWNPMLKAWSILMAEWQEFACDETLILKNKTTPFAYARCLLAHSNHQHYNNSHTLTYLHNSSNLLIYRRIAMLFQYKTNQYRIRLWFPFFMAFLVITASAFAVNDLTPLPPLKKHKVIKLIQKDHLEKLQIEATPEVLSALNNMRTDVSTRLAMRQALQRLSQYRPIIHQKLMQKHMPAELLALPLVESGYRVLPANKNPVAAAGIWQIIPETAKHLGLTVTADKDERLALEPATSAAINYLTSLHHQFGDWKLAVIAYAIGEKLTAQLIRETGSKKAWHLAKAKNAPRFLGKYLGMFDADVIIMHNPELLARK